MKFKKKKPAGQVYLKVPCYENQVIKFLWPYDKMIVKIDFIDLH